MPSVVRVQVTVVGVDFNAVEAELPKVATIVAAPVFANVTFGTPVPAAKVSPLCAAPSKIFEPVAPIAHSPAASPTVVLPLFKQSSITVFKEPDSLTARDTCDLAI
ncbi:hypothetical protein AMPH_23314 [Acinetobacter baumannii]|nr:hypothetical protein AMPH_23314 [Acinetobacter baumannii]